MSDKKFLILIILAAGAYVYFYGLPQRPTQATGGNPFAPATAVYTFDTSQPATVTLSDPVTVVTATPVPAIVLEQVATATAYPIYTAVPVQVFNDYDLPSMGPYSLAQVNLCQEIISLGHIDTLPSPQRELCEMYAGD